MFSVTSLRIHEWVLPSQAMLQVESLFVNTMGLAVLSVTMTTIHNNYNTYVKLFSISLIDIPHPLYSSFLLLSCSQQCGLSRHVYLIGRIPSPATSPHYTMELHSMYSYTEKCKLSSSCPLRQLNLTNNRTFAAHRGLSTHSFLIIRTKQLFLRAPRATAPKNCCNRLRYFLFLVNLPFLSKSQRTRLGPPNTYPISHTPTSHLHSKQRHADIPQFSDTKVENLSNVISSENM